MWRSLGACLTWFLPKNGYDPFSRQSQDWWQCIELKKHQDQQLEHDRIEQIHDRWRER